MALQTFVSALLAYPLYRLNVETNVTKNETSIMLVSRTIFTFLFALPFVFYQPIYVIRALDIHHIGLRMVLMTLPINGGLRILECKNAFGPMYAKSFYKIAQQYFLIQQLTLDLLLPCVPNISQIILHTSVVHLF